jgi:phosphoglycolate phosphatase
MPVLVLWDIDHTLIENNGVNKETYAGAYELITGEPARKPAVTEGRTDLDIMGNMLEANGHAPVSQSRIFGALDEAMRSAAPALAGRGYVLPGAREALSALQAIPEVFQSVLSGSIRPNAEVKLAVFGLEGFIDFEAGGYGSDDRDRTKLVRIAQDRASGKLGRAFGPESTVLIGDTPRDVRAGRVGGAHVIAVASGVDSAERLADEGADLVLPDLRDTSALLAAIGRY